MAITFQIAGYLIDFTGGASKISLSGTPSNLGAALESLWQRHPGLRDRILDEQGVVRPHVNIFVDDANSRLQGGLASSLKEESEILILPAVSGGLS